VHHSEISEAPPAEALLSLVGVMAWPERRAAAATALAQLLGGEELMLFAADPELNVPLPAPGLPQVLRGGAAWREFVQKCITDGKAVGTMPSAGGTPMNAVGCGLDDGTVVVLLGTTDGYALTKQILPVLPLWGALFRAEREVTADAVRITQSAESRDRAQVLARALDGLRIRLQASLADAEEARGAARARAHEAEELAHQLEMQADELQQQAAELELLNEELAERTEEAERAREEADRANQAKSAFLATMSHELRTPINAVIGYAQLLNMGITGPVTEKQRAQLERIATSSEHLLTLVNDVLDLAKVEAGEMEVAERIERSAEVIAQALALVELRAADHGITLHNHCGDGDETYCGDADRVRQILVNLLSNAVKFTSAGGQIHVRCRARDDAPPEAELEGDGPWLSIAVEDTGIGIPPEACASIFQPFVQVDSSYTRERGGTGLGLTISRQLARMMGGNLTVSSTVGIGSCFTLWLPAGTAPSRALDERLRVRGTRAD
jgi:signal transduction histidine kinase